MPVIPKVRHAALQHRGTNRRSLRLRFERRLSAEEQMRVLGEVGFFHTLNKGPALLPEFPEKQGDIVLLNPAAGQNPLMDDFKAAARHFGFIPPNGHLSFINTEGCACISDMPLMPQ